MDRMICYRIYHLSFLSSQNNIGLSVVHHKQCDFGLIKSIIFLTSGKRPFCIVNPLLFYYIIRVLQLSSRIVFRYATKILRYAWMQFHCGVIKMVHHPIKFLLLPLFSATLQRFCATLECNSNMVWLKGFTIISNFYYYHCFPLRYKDSALRLNAIPIWCD